METKHGVLDMGKQRADEVVRLIVAGEDEGVEFFPGARQALSWW